MTRTRCSLGGKSVRDIINDHDDLAVLQAAIAIVVDRAYTQMGAESAAAWLAAHTSNLSDA